MSTDVVTEAVDSEGLNRGDFGRDKKILSVSFHALTSTNGSHGEGSAISADECVDATSDDDKEDFLVGLDVNEDK